MELSKEQILKADDLQIEQVDVPEWGGHVFVRTLNADESYEFNKSNIDKSGRVKEENFIVKYCAFVICNGKGERIFTEAEIEKLGKKNTQVLLRIYKAGQKLNGEDIGELEKNSEQTRSDASTSG